MRRKPLSPTRATDAAVKSRADEPAAATAAAVAAANPDSSLDSRCRSIMTWRASWRVRLANGMMACMFVYSALMQLNDPDWLVWSLRYASFALVCCLLATDLDVISKLRQRRCFLAPALVSYAGVVVEGLSSVFGANDWQAVDLSPDTEMGREALGLLIAGIWLLVCVVVEGGGCQLGVDCAGSRVRRTPLLVLLLIEYAALAFAAAMLVAPVVVPWLLQDTSDMGEGHCTGIGPFQ